MVLKGTSRVVQKIGFVRKKSRNSIFPFLWVILGLTKNLVAKFWVFDLPQVTFLWKRAKNRSFLTFLGKCTLVEYIFKSNFTKFIFLYIIEGPQKNLVKFCFGLDLPQVTFLLKMAKNGSFLTPLGKCTLVEYMFQSNFTKFIFFYIIEGPQQNLVKFCFDLDLPQVTFLLKMAENGSIITVLAQFSQNI